VTVTRKVGLPNILDGMRLLQVSRKFEFVQLIAVIAVEKTTTVDMHHEVLPSDVCSCSMSYLSSSIDSTAAIERKATCWSADLLREFLNAEGWFDVPSLDGTIQAPSIINDV